MDLRIKKTYRALFEAFTELLEEHRFEDVTVAMLCGPRYDSSDDVLQALPRQKRLLCLLYR